MCRVCPVSCVCVIVTIDIWRGVKHETGRRAMVHNRLMVDRTGSSGASGVWPRGPRVQRVART